MVTSHQTAWFIYLQKGHGICPYKETQASVAILQLVVKGATLYTKVILHLKLLIPFFAVNVTSLFA